MAHTTPSAFHSPVRRLDQPQAGGDLGEHCSSPAVGRGVCAPPGRVAQPRLLATVRGYPAGAVNRGRLLFGYFFLATQEKVTSCRATPGGVDLNVSPLLKRRHVCALQITTQPSTPTPSNTPPPENSAALDDRRWRAGDARSAHPRLHRVQHRRRSSETGLR
jgi:hypothetical protein